MPQLPLVGGDGLHQADAARGRDPQRYLLTGERTCIDCHKGIAHELPNMTGVEPGWSAPPEIRGKETSSLHGEEEILRGYLADVAAR